jgi:hypothetical protein
MYEYVVNDTGFTSKLSVSGPFQPDSPTDDLEVKQAPFATCSATIRPHFSGHVLIFKAKITVREEFIRLRRMSGNWVYSDFSLLLSF